MFYNTFQKLVTDKGIPELFDVNGGLVSSWDEMAGVSTSFFENILVKVPQATSPPSMLEEFNEVLYAQQDSLVGSLTAVEKENLKVSLSMEELERAVAALANNKCPGLDRTPNELYKENWPVVGPLILDCISTESFPEFITQGVIVLLQKKADHQQLSNKRPVTPAVTLLNLVYKIGAKALQLWISPILQRKISSQQSTFLPGRNIHHVLLLMSEMLHRAKESGEPHILLKVDVWKTFHRLEWPFLIAIIEQSGMGGILTSFLKASLNSASSLIILNGRTTKAFRLTRSVCQGCPLSPLLFILAFDTLI